MLNKIAMKENIEEFYLYVGERTYYCRFVGNKFYRKYTKTKERDMTDNDEFRGKAYLRGQRITKEEYWAGDPNDENPRILSDTPMQRALRLMMKTLAGNQEAIIHNLKVGLMGENENEMIVGFLINIQKYGATKGDLDEAWLNGPQIGALYNIASGLDNKKPQYELALKVVHNDESLKPK